MNKKKEKCPRCKSSKILKSKHEVAKLWFCEDCYYYFDPETRKTYYWISEYLKEKGIEL